MTESIHIKNFGPIKDIKIDDIRPFTVFIGESGSGKSTIMKVLVLFRYIYMMSNIRSYLKHSNILKSPFEFNFKQFIINSGWTDFIKKDTEIIYTKGSTTIHYKNKLATSPKIPQSELSFDKMCWIADQRSIISDALAHKKIEMNFYLNETYDDFRISDELVNELEFAYLNARYVSESTTYGKKHYIESTDRQNYYKIKLEDASSGMQMITPLSVIIEYFSQHYDIVASFNKKMVKYLYENDRLQNFRAQQNIGDIKNKCIHIHIEEPELSLDPESQRGLINFIVNRCFEKNKNDMTATLTTHSPYIINHLNLLIKAYDKGKLIDGANLNYDDVAVYQVADGEIYDLKIKNGNLINTDPLSETINNIYEEYNELGE